MLSFEIQFDNKVLLVHTKILIILTELHAMIIFQSLSDEPDNRPVFLLTNCIKLSLSLLTSANPQGYETKLQIEYKLHYTKYYII